MECRDRHYNTGVMVLGLTSPDIFLWYAHTGEEVEDGTNAQSTSVSVAKTTHTSASYTSEDACTRARTETGGFPWSPREEEVYTEQSSAHSSSAHVVGEATRNVGQKWQQQYR